MGEESGKEEMLVVEEVRKVKIHSSGTGIWMKPTVGEAISETTLSFSGATKLFLLPANMPGFSTYQAIFGR